MPKPNTSIEIKGIASVLSTTKLEVPIHQRSFEWTGEVLELLDTMIEGKRLRDISDLPLDLAT